MLMKASMILAVLPALSSAGKCSDRGNSCAPGDELSLIQVQKVIQPGTYHRLDNTGRDLEAKTKVLPKRSADGPVTFVGTVDKCPWYFWFNRKAGLADDYWAAKAAENDAEADEWLLNHRLENRALWRHHIINNRIGWNIYAANHDPWSWDYVGDDWLDPLGYSWLDSCGDSSENVTANALENGRHWNKAVEGLGNAGHHQPSWRKDWEVAAVLPVDPSSRNIELEESQLNVDDVFAVEKAITDAQVTGLAGNSRQSREKMVEEKPYPVRRNPTMVN